MSLKHKGKYLKYKLKYLQKKQKIMKGGGTDEMITENFMVIQNQIDKLKKELQELKTKYETHYHETKGIKH